MPNITKPFHIDITPEQFLNACSPEELQELELLIQKPQYQHKMHQEEPIEVRCGKNIIDSRDKSNNHLNQR